MFKQLRTFLVLAMVLYSTFDKTNGQLTGVSWVYRGTAQQNNTALTFNLYDTLNLVCRASISSFGAQTIFAISKGSVPSGMSYAAGVLTLNNVGTLIYSDIDGIKAGFENFVVIASPYNTATVGSQIYEFRYINVGSLKTTDSATYSCSAGNIDGSVVFTSGRLTITVNTQSGQAHSSQTRVNRLLAYTTAMLAASSFCFK